MTPLQRAEGVAGVAAPATGKPEVSTDDLRLLLAVARTGRMVAAAAILGIDHTTVHRRIQRLEASLGVGLIERGSDGWELTELGRTVSESAAALDDIVERVRDAVAGEKGTIRGTVRIAAPDGFGVSFVTPAVNRVLERHPGLSVELVTSTRPMTTRSAGFDMSINIGSPRSNWIASEHLTQYELGLYASPAYLAGHAPIRSLEDLKSHRLVFYVESLQSVAELDLARQFAGMRVGFACTNVAAQVAATQQGAGIGLLPAFLAEHHDGLERVLRDDVRFLLHFTLSIRSASVAVDAISLIRTQLRAEVSDRERELLPAS